MLKLKPWLWLPASWSHFLSPYALAVISLFQNSEMPVWKPFSWRGMLFKNPLGLAGGVDKDADQVIDWWRVGAGFVEVGTITPELQKGNPGVVMGRDLVQKALWNRMGFPSHGMDEAFYNLTHLVEKRSPILVNIGKNRTTAIDDAAADYIQCMERLQTVADIFVINISSPNTKGLRDLQTTQSLKNFLEPIVTRSQKLKKPILVKLSPDMSASEFVQSIQTCANLKVDGFVLTNTTLAREKDSPFSAEGGVSGAPLSALSKKALRLAIETLGPERQDKLIVSVGGVLSPEDVFERLEMGADLVEVYSALIFEGPWFFRQVSSAFEKLKKS